MKRLPAEVALSVRQPWAWAIVSGRKDVENRTWTTRYRGRLMIHASLRIDHDGVLELRRRGVKEPSEYVRGAIIGVVDLVDVVTDSRSRWALRDHYHFVLRNAVMLEKPIVLPGRLGLFKPERFEPVRRATSTGTSHAARERAARTKRQAASRRKPR